MLKNIRFSPIWKIAKKELGEMFHSATAYIVLGLFVIGLEYLFFPAFFEIKEASLAPLFGILPWLLLLFVPALTMRSLAQEKEQGTLEFVLTQPVSAFEVILGKYLSILIFGLIALALTLPIMIGGQFFGQFDLGLALGQYLSGFYLVAILGALGIFVSSAFKNSLAALLVGVTASFGLLAIGLDFVTVRLPLFLSGFLSSLSALTHYEALARGVIDLRDVIYGLLAILIFLTLAFLQLKKVKVSRRAKTYLSLRLWALVFIGAAVFLSVLGYQIPGRLDLTQGHLYTLSSGTKNVLSALSDPVSLNFYASDKIPAQLQPRVRYVGDLLHDYQIAGHGEINIVTKNPDANSDTQKEADQFGIQPVQFNVIQQGEFQAKSGYLGLAVVYKDQHEVMPFVQSTDDLEYQLTSYIHKLTAKDKPAIGFLTNDSSRSLDSDYSILKNELAKQFTVEPLTLDEKKPVIAADVKTLIIADPTKAYAPPVQKALTDFLAQGGAALVMVDTMNVNMQTLSASQVALSPADLLKDFGGSVNRDLVFDLRSNQSLTFNTGQVSLLLPYPFWLQALAAKDSAFLGANGQGTTLPWPSSLSLDAAAASAKNLNAQKILITSPFAGLKTFTNATPLSLNPNQNFPQTQADLAERLLAVAISPKDKNSGPRLIVVGDSDFLMDQFVQQIPANLNFGLTAVEWLTQSADLSSIRSRNTAPRALVFGAPSEMTALQYGSLGVALVLIIGFGLGQFLRRRSLGRLSF